ncbi:unnamed protein product [Arctogadus glacialis]
MTRPAGGPTQTRASSTVCFPDGAWAIGSKVTSLRLNKALRRRFYDCAIPDPPGSPGHLGRAGCKGTRGCCSQPQERGGCDRPWQSSSSGSPLPVSHRRQPAARPRPEQPDIRDHPDLGGSCLSSPAHKGVRSGRNTAPSEPPWAACTRATVISWLSSGGDTAKQGAVYLRPVFTAHPRPSHGTPHIGPGPARPRDDRAPPLDTEVAWGAVGVPPPPPPTVSTPQC